MVFVGAGFGALGRYWLGSKIQSVIGGNVPWGTLTVNASGSLLIGIAMAAFLSRNLSEDWRLFFVTGVLGGYTTFSAFSFETLDLMRAKLYGLAAGYVAASLILSFLMCWIGSLIGNAAFKA